MKYIFLSLVIALYTISANAQMDLPAAGGNIRATISEEVGITSITIKYSRPGVKGRDGKIWGTLVTNGFSTPNLITNKNESPWRAGANEATIITFEHDVKVEGNDLKAGTYALFMAMDANSVTIIFSKQANAWGSFYYKPEDDVLRINVKPVALEKSVEWLKYEFITHKENQTVIALQWEKTSIPFKVEVDTDVIVLEKLRQEVTGAKGFLSANLIHASQYCFNKNINLEEALTWAKRAVSGPFGQPSYLSLSNLALGYEKLNRQAEADLAMKEALTTANINQFSVYSKTLIAQKRIDKAIEIILLAQTNFGDILPINNLFTSAYSAKSDFAKALEYANKALLQATTESAKAKIIENIEKLKLGKDIN
jgi:tetratricopeptide (TPR) repeat protein